MHDVFTVLDEIKNLFVNSFNTAGIELNEPEMAHFNKQGWSNQCWTSSCFRQAQLNIIQTDALYMMHCCIFPHLDNPGPIFGFDVFAGTKKITGCFHDFSPTDDPNHNLINWFDLTVSSLNWSKTRQLPDWANSIFSPYIITASNIRQEVELTQIKTLVELTSNYYIQNISKTNHLNFDTINSQNYYCNQQRLNPHNVPVLINLGLSQEQAERYVQICLFPQI